MKSTALAQKRSSFKRETEIEYVAAVDLQLRRLQSYLSLLKLEAVNKKFKNCPVL